MAERTTYEYEYQAQNRTPEHPLRPGNQYRLRNRTMRALSTGPDHEYRKDSTPGTADHAEPRHMQGGPGHKIVTTSKEIYDGIIDFAVYGHALGCVAFCMYLRRSVGGISRFV